jgi:cell division protein FtsB
MATNRSPRQTSSRTPDATSPLRARPSRRDTPLRPASQERGAYVRTRNAEQFRALEGRSVRRRDERRRRREEQRQQARQGRERFLLTAVFAVLIFFVGLLPLLTTFRQYVASQSQVADLQAQEQSLKREKSDLDEQINRWNDNAYVIAQARTRLGFVYPGETSVRVIGAEKYADQQGSKQTGSSADSVEQKSLPWNEMLRRSLLQADAGASQTHRSGRTGGTDGSSSSSSSSSKTGSSSGSSTKQDPSQTYTPANGTQKNPYSLTEQERQDAQKKQKEQAGSAGTGTSSQDLGGLL